MTQLGTSEPSLRRSEKPGTPLNSADVDESRAPATIKNHSSMLHSSVPALLPTLPDADEAVVNEDYASTMLSKSSATSHFAAALPLAPTNLDERRPVVGINKDHPSSLSKFSSSYPLPADIVFADYLLRSNRQMVLSTSTIQPRWQDWTWAQLRLPQFQALDHDSHHGDLFLHNDATLSLSLLAHS
jgi:hypothetical protein